MRVMFDNGSEIIDSRDIIERLADLAGQWAAHANDPTEPELEEDEIEEMQALTALAEEGENVSDWQYGEALIRDSYFEEYAVQLAEDIGAISSDDAWPISYIDWGRAADALKMDYTALDFAGVTYWARS